IPFDLYPFRSLLLGPLRISSDLYGTPSCRSIRLHFLRERTRHGARDRLRWRRRRLEPLRRLDLDLVVAVDPGSRRDEVPDDDVLLEPQEVVPGAPDRRVRQHAGRLLERRRRDERLRGEARLRNAEQQGLAHGGLAALLLDALGITKASLTKIGRAHV